MNDPTPAENGHQEIKTLRSAQYGPPGSEPYEWKMPAELAVRVLVSISKEDGGRTFRRHLAAVITGTEPDLAAGRRPRGSGREQAPGSG